MGGWHIRGAWYLCLATLLNRTLSGLPLDPIPPRWQVQRDEPCGANRDIRCASGRSVVALLLRTNGYLRNANSGPTNIQRLQLRTGVALEDDCALPRLGSFTRPDVDSRFRLHTDVLWRIGSRPRRLLILVTATSEANCDGYQGGVWRRVRSRGYHWRRQRVFFGESGCSISSDTVFVDSFCT